MLLSMLAIWLSISIMDSCVLTVYVSLCLLNLNKFERFLLRIWGVEDRIALTFFIRITDSAPVNDSYRDNHCDNGSKSLEHLNEWHAKILIRTITRHECHCRKSRCWNNCGDVETPSKTLMRFRILGILYMRLLPAFAEIAIIHLLRWQGNCWSAGREHHSHQRKRHWVRKTKTTHMLTAIVIAQFMVTTDCRHHNFLIDDDYRTRRYAPA